MDCWKGRGRVSEFNSGKTALLLKGNGIMINQMEKVAIFIKTEKLMKDNGITLQLVDLANFIGKMAQLYKESGKMMYSMVKVKNGLWMELNLKENLYRERRMDMESLNGGRMNIMRESLRII